MHVMLWTDHRINPLMRNNCILRTKCGLVSPVWKRKYTVQKFLESTLLELDRKVAELREILHFCSTAKPWARPECFNMHEIFSALMRSCALALRILSALVNGPSDFGHTVRISFLFQFFNFLDRIYYFPKYKQLSKVIIYYRTLFCYF